MAQKKVYRQESFYSSTAYREFYLDIWPGENYINSDGEKLQEIPTKFHRRPDLMAYELYGNPNYWWVFAVRNKNKLIDPVEDFKAGLSIYVPSRTAARSLI